MKKKSLSILFLVCFVFPSFISAQEMFERKEFQLLKSQIYVSENGEYNLVIVPIISIDEYNRKKRENLERIGYSMKEIDGWLKGKEYLKLIEEERKLRRTYKISGLYKKGVDAPIHVIESFPEETERVFVANDGSYVLGYNAQVVVPSIRNEVSDEQLIKTDQKALYSLFFNGGKVNACSKRISDLVNNNEPLERTSEAFYWADKNAVLDRENETLTITKLNDAKVIFDIKACKIIRNDEQKTAVESSASKKEQTSFCLGLSLLIILIFWISS